MPLLFPGETAQPLRRERHVPRPVHLRAWPIVVAIGLRLLLYRTQIGLDMRASVDSRPLAMLHGARPASLGRHRLGHRLRAGRRRRACWSDR